MSLYPGTFLKSSYIPPYGITNPAGYQNYTGIAITRDELAKMLFRPCNFKTYHSFAGLIHNSESSPTLRTISGFGTPPTSNNAYWYGYSYGTVPMYGQGGAYSGSGSGVEPDGTNATSQAFRIANPPVGLDREPMVRIYSDYDKSTGITPSRLWHDVMFYPSLIGNSPVLLIYYQNVAAHGNTLATDFYNTVTASGTGGMNMSSYYDPFTVPLTIFGRTVNLTLYHVTTPHPVAGSISLDISLA